MAVLRSDKHGLYIKLNGSYYRPVFPIGYKHLEKDLDINSMLVGDSIKAKNLSGTPLAKINDHHWYVHGNYSDFTSEEAFKPSFEDW